jgi:hypothetical protein|tara:strand:+ start:335 stop:487 length:153 start_codon:yes stop_codon:yes gene_type:complete
VGRFLVTREKLLVLGEGALKRNHPAIYKHDNSIIVAHPLDKMNQKYGAFI